MNKLMVTSRSKIVMLILLSLCYQCKQSKEAKRLKVAFTIYENDAVPEGIAYDPVEKTFYISSTYKRKIIKVDRNGSVSGFITEAQHGIHGVLGMKVDSKRRILWAVSTNLGAVLPIKAFDSLELGITSLYKFQLETGQLLNKYVVDCPRRTSSMNDLVLDNNGKPYITDTRGQKIFTVKANTDTLEEFIRLPSGYRPNGIDITPDGKFLLVALYASSGNKYGRIEVNTKKFDTLGIKHDWPTGADGLYFYKNGLIAIIPDDPQSKVLHYELNNSLTEFVRLKVLIEADPIFSQPSTGVIINNKFYFIATSNLQRFARLFSENNGKVNPRDLAPVIIGEIPLHANFN